MSEIAGVYRRTIIRMKALMSQHPAGVVAGLFRADHEMITLLGRIAALILVLLFPAPSRSQTHSGYPVDIIAGPAPQAVVVDGRTRLAYELHLTNFAPWPIEITGVDVLGSGASTVASFNRDGLNKLVVPAEKALLSVEPTDSTGKSRTVGEGHTVVIFLDLVARSRRGYSFGAAS
jgi:hypothetical protein